MFETEAEQYVNLLFVNTESIFDVFLNSKLGELSVFLLGVTVLVASFMAWTGQWKAWAKRPWWGTMPLHLYPGLGLMFTLGGLGALLNLSSESKITDIAATIILIVVFVGSGVYLLSFIREPKSLTPSWLHTFDRTSDPKDESSALGYIMQAVNRAEIKEKVDKQREKVRKSFAGSERKETWNAQYIYKPESRERTHAFGVAGGLGGKLVLYSTGLGFELDRLELALIEETFEMKDVFKKEDIEAVWSVKAGRNAEGKRTQTSLNDKIRRILNKRLVIQSQGETYMFEMRNAEAKADLIGALFQVERRTDLT